MRMNSHRRVQITAGPVADQAGGDASAHMGRHGRMDVQVCARAPVGAAQQFPLQGGLRAGDS